MCGPSIVMLNGGVPAVGAATEGGDTLISGRVNGGTEDEGRPADGVSKEGKAND